MKKKSVTVRNKIGSSKSLSELEFEELKGFMDLDFVFSEEDTGSRLVSVIPGLQRLGRKAKEEASDDNIISRPYLQYESSCQTGWTIQNEMISCL
ncbi:hypothetical protein Acr_00g0096730 [Actinidia rufa]|uniref:Uncharacterized protein n=1 Tax=Actinidia rufa TaxID=165716 RepID=A0A7J0DYY7_9ERIC|nr:hypothetical protein Acr_00g0096730 [Actinidia rufa]